MIAAESTVEHALRIRSFWRYGAIKKHLATMLSAFQRGPTWNRTRHLLIMSHTCVYLLVNNRLYKYTVNQ